MIAALYVETNGVYYGLPYVDPWNIVRDARTYSGPYPVVAHPPCARWSRMQGFVEYRHPGRFKRGDDGGCFSAALAAVRKFGGILEHPEASSAWQHFGLTRPPQSGGWIRADAVDGWTCCIEQGAYGHKARKRTWLYAHGVVLPSLLWSGKTPRKGTNSGSEDRRLSRTGIVQRQSKRQRAATPVLFRDLLLSIAGTAQ